MRVAVLRAVGIRRLPVEPRGIEVLRRQQHIHTGAVRQRLDAQVVDGAVVERQVEYRRAAGREIVRARHGVLLLLQAAAEAGQDRGGLRADGKRLRAEQNGAVLGRAGQIARADGPAHGAARPAADRPGVRIAGEGRLAVPGKVIPRGIAIEDGRRLFACDGVVRAEAPVAVAVDDLRPGGPRDGIGVPHAVADIGKFASGRGGLACQTVKHLHEHGAGRGRIRLEFRRARSAHQPLPVGIGDALKIPRTARDIAKRQRFGQEALQAAVVAAVAHADEQPAVLEPLHSGRRPADRYGRCVGKGRKAIRLEHEAEIIIHTRLRDGARRERLADMLTIRRREPYHAGPALPAVRQMAGRVRMERRHTLRESGPTHQRGRHAGDGDRSNGLLCCHGQRLCTACDHAARKLQHQRRDQHTDDTLSHALSSCVCGPAPAAPVVPSLFARLDGRKPKLFQRFSAL